MRRGLLLLIVPFYMLALAMVQLLLIGLIMDPPWGGRDVIESLVHDPRRFGQELFLEPWGLVYVVGPVVVVTALQAMFLLPVRPVRLVRDGPSRSLRWSIASSAFIAALLVLGLAGALVEAGQWLVAGEEFAVEDGIVWWILPLAVLPVSWFPLSILLARFARRGRSATALDRLAAAVFAGTVAEVLVVLPLDVMVRRRTNCYCSTGSAHALWLASVALVWLTGPGIFLAVTSRQRRRWFDDECPKCGYRRGPSPGDRCPECGSPWPPDATRAEPISAGKPALSGEARTEAKENGSA
ncbi:MAG: hypothetical protein KDA22_07615 [Phycisphaerales bacterium]|nr:hypothetical protein [Phycisphaerales bacterium]